jgi:ubiquinone/menaquinone biosynthesis C-methylase UbiE
MRVADIGCGPGEVSVLIAHLVGEAGRVLGIDRDARQLDAARKRASEHKLSQVTFAQDDFQSLSQEHGLFDAVVGRRVLMYQPNAVEAVRSLANAVKPNGLVIFHEHDSSILHAHPERLPLHERVHGWIWRTIEREGGNVHMGFELARVLELAGLHVEHVRAEAVVQIPGAHYTIAPIIRAMLHRIVQQGVASESEIDVDTLDQRLAEERRKANATYIGEMVFGAWARKPE